MSQVEDLLLHKKLLRKIVSERLDSLEYKEKSREAALITKKITASAEWKFADFILCYSHFGTEFNPNPLLRSALAAGKRLAFPRLTTAKGGEGKIPLMDFRETEGLEGPWTLHKWGFREPEPGCRLFNPREHEKEKTLLLCPGIAFDPEGFRLGRGGGYYDAYLSLHSEDLTVIAPAFSCQMLEKVPREVHDQKVERVFHP